MSLVNARAAFEKAITDAVVAADNTVIITYDNVNFTTPGKTKKYISTSITFNQSTIQAQGAASDYYSGAIQCNIYVPKEQRFFCFVCNRRSCNRWFDFYKCF